MVHRQLPPRRCDGPHGARRPPSAPPRPGSAPHLFLLSHPPPPRPPSCPASSYASSYASSPRAPTPQPAAPPLQVSHNRKFVVSGGEEGEVRVWEIRTREMILHLKQHTMAITSLCVFEDDSQVISAEP